MNRLILDSKKYIVVEQNSFEKLQIKAAQKMQPVKKLSLFKSKEYAYKLIDAWAKEK